MTISSTTRKAGPFIGNGVTVSFPFTFKVFSSADVRVVIADADGIETEQILGAYYTVTLNADQNTTPGGSVITDVAVVSGSSITLLSKVANLQPLDLTNSGGFYPEIINTAFDRSVIQVQQLAEEVSRGTRLPVSTPADVSAELPPPLAGSLLGWSATGKKLVNLLGGISLPTSVFMSDVLMSADETEAKDLLGIGVNVDVGKKAKFQYGTIRQTTDAGGWTFINDATHQYAGFTDAITVVSGNLVVPYNSNATKVGTLVAVPDETFAALGLELGASVGLSSATISLYKPLYVTVDLATLVCTPSPFFTGTVSAVNNGNGTVTITHPTVGATGALATVDNKTKHKTTLTSSTATSTIIESIVEFGGNISYDGTNWVVNTPTYLKPTMVFSAGTLTVTHNVFGAADANVVVTTRDNATTLCTMGNATSTNFTVVFRDYTGALITTPSTDMKFFYQGTQMMTRETPVGQILLTRNHCKLDANNFFAASGNIWLMGASNV